MAVFRKSEPKKVASTPPPVVRVPPKPKRPKVDPAEKRKVEREELAEKMRASDLTVDEKRAMVREFNEK